MKIFKFWLISVLFIIFFVTSSMAIGSEELFKYEGCRIQIGVVYELQNSIATITVEGILLNVVNGADLFDNQFSGYYAVIRVKTSDGREKSILLPCSKITYVMEMSK